MCSTGCSSSICWSGRRRANINLKEKSEKHTEQVKKLQLAIEYSYQVRRSSPQTWVFWIHASSKARIEEEYRRIAEATRVSRWDDPIVDILQLVHAWLCDESNGKWVCKHDIMVCVYKG